MKTYRKKVVSYSCSTSNHNISWDVIPNFAVVSYSCSTSNHNLSLTYPRLNTVVSYSCSTSNHNMMKTHTSSGLLYLIRVLHQTTTRTLNLIKNTSCILFVFYIKPQPVNFISVRAWCCILFVFYIKPQRIRCLFILMMVVSYSCSTSNHNDKWATVRRIWVVSYSCSTSNHNL